MSSMYLGRIYSKDGAYQIHAFTNGLPFREFPTSEISDPSLFEAMLRGRYEVLTSGREVLWGGVDEKKRQERNPHDDRPGTVHIAALDANDQRMVCVISIAVDTGETDHGELIGLPLENRWKRNEKFRSPSLDKFRESYFGLNYHSEAPVKPYQMAELYRHYRVNDIDANVPRLAICTGAYDLLIRAPRRAHQIESFLWVFYAIAPYFDLYRTASAAVLRDFTIKSPPRQISPGPDQISYKRVDNVVRAYWGEETIAESVKVPQYYIDAGSLKFTMEDVVLIDGLVDIHAVEKAVKESPIELRPLKCEGMTEEDMLKVRAAVSIVGRRGYEEYHGNNPRVMAIINHYSMALGVKSEFSDTGSHEDP